MNRRSSLAKLALLGAMLLLGVGLVSYTGRKGSVASPGATAVIPSATPYPLATTVQGAAAESPPLYPGARNVREEFKRDTLDRRQQVITHEFDGSDTDVLAYYRQILPAHGWTSEDQTPNIYPAHFVWSDPAGANRWRLSMSVELLTTGAGIKFIELNLIRWPDGNKVPLYPDAQQVTIDTGQTPCQSVARTITYVTSASWRQVEAYYKDVLPQQGWWIIEPMCVKPGTHYTFYMGVPESRVSESLIVYITIGADGLTRVKLTISGYGVTE